jgi:hypothetical protein
MNKIITSEETDIEFDPESIADETINNPFMDRSKRLEAIRELDQILSNPQNLFQIPEPKPIITVSKNKKYNCTIQAENNSRTHMFSMKFNIVSLNQTLVERNVTELEIEGEQNSLIKFFCFYQSSVSKQRKRFVKNKRQLHMLFNGNKRLVMKKKRKTIIKNDVFVIKLYTQLNGKQINLIDYENEEWRITEMKYAFDNNRSTIKMLLTRNK